MKNGTEKTENYILFQLATAKSAHQPMKQSVRSE